MIKLTTRGSWNKLESFLDKAQDGTYMSSADIFGERGVKALQNSTPIESGETANAWSYDISKTSNSYTIWWANSNVVDGYNVAAGLQYGHATRDGLWVEGTDYINPAMDDIFDKAISSVWKELNS